MERRHITVQGRVQGVGFRQATYQQALRLHLTGWVRNAPDRSDQVVMEVEGSRHDIDSLLAWLYQGPPLAKVQSVVDVPIPLARDARFVIRH